MDWSHALPTIVASFLASLVECVEALTVVLAIGAVRGWRDALLGTVAALVCLLLLVVILGTALTRIPLDLVQLFVGGLLLLFGLRWLRKAILRAAGALSLHDETAAYEAETAAMRKLGGIRRGWDRAAFVAAFKIVMLEGVEVVFIVVAIGTGRAGLLLPASLGALAALFLVVLLGLVVHRPLARVPENTLKFVVGLLLSAFGTFWVAEGIGLAWPGGDWAIAGLLVAYTVLSLVLIAACRARLSQRRAGP